MILNYSIYKNDKGVETKGFFITEGKDSVRVSKSGKSYSFLVNEKSLILVKNGEKEYKLTGMELINKIFA